LDARYGVRAVQATATLTSLPDRAQVCSPGCRRHSPASGPTFDSRPSCGPVGPPTPRSGGGHAQDVDTAGSKLDHEQHIQALQQDGVDVKEGAGQDSLGLRGQELPPSQPGAAGCRVDAGPLENQPHRAWRDLVPKPSQFSVDAAVAPGRVLGCQPQDQAPQLRWDRRPTGWAVRFGPVASDQVPMPAQYELPPVSRRP
jgi:hypothetical protein